MKITAVLLTMVLLAASEPKGRKTAPDFALKDVSGATVSLSAQKGKVVLLDFWATWCHGCKTEIPWFMEFATKYRDRGLAVIGVSRDDDGWASVRPYMKEKGMNYPVVIGTDDLAKRYDVTALPVTFIIDRNGAIAFVHAGLPKRGKAEVESEIRDLLGESRSDGRFAPAIEFLKGKPQRDVELGLPSRTEQPGRTGDMRGRRCVGRRSRPSR
jgi:peroxiredoxin